MPSNHDINKDIKWKLKDPLKRFPTLFVWGLRNLSETFSVAHTKLRERTRLMFLIQQRNDKVGGKTAVSQLGQAIPPLFQC